MKKFVALLLALTLSLSTFSFASAQYSKIESFEFNSQDVLTFSLFRKVIDVPKVQALFVVSVSQYLADQSNPYKGIHTSHLKLDESSPAFVLPYFAQIYIYYKSREYESYLFMKVSDNAIESYVIVPDGSKYPVDFFLNTGDSYETPEQMTACLDAQGYTYYTVTPESLAEAMTALGIEN